MSYCAFQNTRGSLNQCKRFLEALESGEDEALSLDEKKACIDLFDTMQEMVELIKNHHSFKGEHDEPIEGVHLEDFFNLCKDQHGNEYDDGREEE